MGTKWGEVAGGPDHGTSRDDSPSDWGSQQGTESKRLAWADLHVKRVHRFLSFTSKGFS